MSPTLSFGIIILAAGNSSRLGQPKQLLQFNGKSLIRNVTEAALSLHAQSVVIVTGANEDAVSSELRNIKVHFAYNPDWQEGMGSSIRAGLSKLLSLNPSTDFIILAVSDQPFVTSDIFQKLVDQGNATNNAIVACSYQNVTGTPVLFKKKHFDSLLNLVGTAGAKKLLKQFESDVSVVPFLKGHVDIDTQEDYNRLLKS